MFLIKTIIRHEGRWKLFSIQAIKYFEPPSQSIDTQTADDTVTDGTVVSRELPLQFHASSSIDTM